MTPVIAMIILPSGLGLYSLRRIAPATILFVIIYSVCVTGAAPVRAESAGISSGTGALSEGESDYRISLGYWNDNFLFEKLMGMKARGSRDDFETASFWLQVSRERSGKWWICDSNFSILTDKAGQFRTDILAVSLSRDFTALSGTLRTGLGLAANGDFGGGSIQNGYHRVFGYRKVNLPYSLKSRIGIIGFLRYKPVF